MEIVTKVVPLSQYVADRRRRWRFWLDLIWAWSGGLCLEMEIVYFWSGIDRSGILLDLLIYDFGLLKKGISSDS